MDKSRCKYASDERLSSYVDGHLDGDDLRSLSHHINTCLDCSEVVGKLRQLKAFLSTSVTPSVPPNEDFWANAYRTARLSTRKEPASVAWIGGLQSILSRNLRLVASSLAAIALAVLLLAPAIRREIAPLPSVPVVSQDSASNMGNVDSTSLLRSHVQYDADTQPFADDPRLSMVLSEEASQKDEVSAAAGLPSCDFSDDACSTQSSQASNDGGAD